MNNAHNKMMKATKEHKGEYLNILITLRTGLHKAIFQP